MATRTDKHNCPPELQRLTELPISMTYWRRIKSTLYALLITAFAIWVILQDADPTAVFFGAATVIAVIYTSEVKEVQLAQFATITFYPDSSTDDDDGDDS